MSEQRISISLSNLLTILLVVLLVWLLWQLQSLLIAVMFAVVLAAAIAPIVDWAEKRRIPRWLAVIGVYLSLISGFVGVGVLIGPSVIQQIELLVTQIPTYSERLLGWLQDLVYHVNANQPELVPQLVDAQALTSWIIRSSQQLVIRSLGLTRGIVGAVFGLVLVILLSGYMVASSQTLVRGVLQLFPQPWDQRLMAQVEPVGKRMGSFVQGRVLVSAILGVFITLGLSILGLPEFSLALGVIAGMTNLIPFVGPFLGAIPALIVAASEGGLLWLWVLLLFVVVQNLESYVLDPLLVGSSVNVHPLYQLLAVLGGTQVLGILGALIVPPWIAGATVLLEELYLKPKLQAQSERTPEQEAVSDGIVTMTN
jgi:predicted PurR-regulated permease PerM